MRRIMDSYRAKTPTPCDFSPVSVLDYSEGLDGLPPSNVLKIVFDGASITARPSGTEPKLKLYAYAEGKSEAEARKRVGILLSSLEAYFK